MVIGLLLRRGQGKSQKSLVKISLIFIAIYKETYLGKEVVSLGGENQKHYLFIYCLLLILYYCYKNLKLF